MAKATEWPKFTKKIDEIDTRRTWTEPTDPIPPTWPRSPNWRLVGIVDCGDKVIGYWEPLDIEE